MQTNLEDKSFVDVVVSSKNNHIKHHSQYNFDYIFGPGSFLWWNAAPIDISGMAVNVLNGLLYDVEIEFFIHVAATLPACKINIYNTDIFIDSRLLTGMAFPPRALYEKHKLPFATLGELNAINDKLRKRQKNKDIVVTKEELGKKVAFDILSKVFKANTEKAYVAKILPYLRNNTVFPKHLSMVCSNYTVTQQGSVDSHIVHIALFKK